VTVFGSGALPVSAFRLSVAVGSELDPAAGAFGLGFLAGVGLGVGVGVGVLSGTSGAVASGSSSSVGSTSGSAVGLGVGLGAGFGVGEAVLPELPVLVWALTTPLVADPEVVVEPVGLSSDPVDVAVGTVEACGAVEAALSPVFAEAVFEDVVVPDALALADWLLEEPVDVSSALATPYPVATAVPTPNATARPPTRPMYLDAPMTGPPDALNCSSPVKADFHNVHSCCLRRRAACVTGRSVR
jgi:hypothetical protein